MSTRIQLDDVIVRYPVYANALSAEGAGDRIVRGRNGHAEIEALRGVSVTFKPGDRVGLVGRNGSGKSTLLKIFGRILLPEQGRVTIEGRTLTILNLIAGFELDRTGRENIRFISQLFGLKRDRTRVLEDDILEFSELGEFLEMPVRTYSSGMRIRLAFGLYTALPHDILIIDEILGAGDSYFHEKANARISSTIEGADILVVATHSKRMLDKYCNRALHVDKGHIVCDGDPDSAWDSYQQGKS